MPWQTVKAHKPAGLTCRLSGRGRQVFVDQKAVEVYYRFHVTDEIAVTPSVQYIKDPPLNVAQDELYLLSIRGRAAF